MKDNRIDATKFAEWKLPRSLKKLTLVGCEGTSIFTQKNLNQVLPVLTKEIQLPIEAEEASRVFVQIGIFNNCLVENILEKSRNYLVVNKLNLNLNELYSIPEDILSLRRCTSLGLSFNKFNNFPLIVTRMDWITKLDFRSNQLTCLPNEIENLTSLKEIWLESNCFSQFPSQLQRLPKLQRIWFDKNQIDALPHVVIVNLQRLSLSSNKLTKVDGILKLKLLQFLFLSDNQIEALPAEINQLQFLRKLHLNNNCLSSLPEGIVELRNLEDLQLRDNRILELPVRIGELTRLKILDLKGNLIRNLPLSMGILKLDVCHLKENPLQYPSELIEDWKLMAMHLIDSWMGTEVCNIAKMIVVC